MIAGVFNNQGLLHLAEPGVTLTSTKEIIDCSVAVEFTMSKLSPKASEFFARTFEPLSKAAGLALKQSVQKDELNQEPATLESHGVLVSFTSDTAKFAQDALRLYAKKGCSNLIKPDEALSLADEIGTNLDESEPSRVHLN